MTRSNRVDHIRITSHPAPGAKLNFPIHWGAATRARARTGDRHGVPSARSQRHRQPWRFLFGLPRLAVSSGALDPIRRPDLTNTHPAETIGPFPQWSDPQRIVSLDPWGHLAAENFATEIAEGIDIRPTIAITRARLDLPEMKAAIEAGRLKHDGEVVHKNGSVSVVKIAIDPVWYLPGMAQRFATTENNLRRATVRADRRHVSGAGDATGPAGVSAADRRHDGLFLRRRHQTAGPPHQDNLPRARRVQRLGRVRLRHLHLPPVPDSRHRGMRAGRRRPAGSASSSTIARKAARSARSPNSWSTMRASARKAAMPRPSISSAPNASPACRTRASSN